MQTFVTQYLKTKVIAFNRFSQQTLDVNIMIQILTGQFKRNVCHPQFVFGAERVVSQIWLPYGAEYQLVDVILDYHHYSAINKNKIKKKILKIKSPLIQRSSKSRKRADFHQTLEQTGREFLWVIGSQRGKIRSLVGTGTFPGGD